MMSAATICPSQPVNTSTLRSRIAELRIVEGNSRIGAEEEENLLNDVTYELQSKVDCVFSEYSSDLYSLSSEDLDEVLGQLKSELVQVETETADLECEIEKLQRRHVEDYGQLESELEKLCCSLETFEWQTPEVVNEDMQIDAPCPADDQSTVPDDCGSNFKILELGHQIEKSETNLRSLQDLDSIFKRFEVVEKIEDSFTGVRIIEVEGNTIRLSLKTYIPYLEFVLQQQDIENVIEPLEMNHELVIETIDGTQELKNVEIFPNDVYIGEILDAAKTFRQLYPTFSVIETRSSLEFFLRRVMDRISLSSLRRFVVNNAEKSRQSFEYVDREDIIVAHLVGGVDALIKVPQGWPLSDLPLELISLKSTSQYSKEISLGLLCEITEVANSLNNHSRRNVKRFSESIEEILMQRMRAQLRPASAS